MHLPTAGINDPLYFRVPAKILCFGKFIEPLLNFVNKYLSVLLVNNKSGYMTPQILEINAKSRDTD